MGEIAINIAVTVRGIGEVEGEGDVGTTIPLSPLWSINILIVRIDCFTSQRNCYNCWIKHDTLINFIRHNRRIRLLHKMHLLHYTRLLHMKLLLLHKKLRPLYPNQKIRLPHQHYRKGWSSDSVYEHLPDS